MQPNRVNVSASLVVMGIVLWGSPAFAGGIGGAGAVLGGVGGSQFSALASIKTMLTSNIAMIASIGILALGLAFAFSKGAWMEIVGGLAALVFLLVAVGWAANNTNTFFGSGALLPPPRAPATSDAVLVHWFAVLALLLGLYGLAWKTVNALVRRARAKAPLGLRSLAGGAL